MADKAMDVYLNDHLAGAMVGTELAAHLRDRSEGTSLGDAMKSIALQIEEDRLTLVDLMERMGTSRNPVKQAGGWVAEKASRVKFSGLMSGEPAHGAFTALESLTLGVEGKRSLWKALKEVAGQYPALASTNLDELIDRADGQHSALERERLAAAKQTFSNSP